MLAEGAGDFLPQSELRVLTLIWCPFHLCVNAVAHKRPWLFCQKCRWQVTPKHTYTFDPAKLQWADYAVVQAQCGNLSGNELTHNLSGNLQPQLSLLAEALWTDPGIKSGNCCVRANLHFNSNNNKTCRQGMNGRTFSKDPCMREKAAIFYNRLHVLSERGVLYHMHSLFKRTVCRRTLQAPPTLPECLSNLVTGFQHGLSSLSRHSCWLPVLSEFS